MEYIKYRISVSMMYEYVCECVYEEVTTNMR